MKPTASPSPLTAWFAQVIQHDQKRPAVERFVAFARQAEGDAAVALTLLRKASS